MVGWVAAMLGHAIGFGAVWIGVLAAILGIYLGLRFLLAAPIAFVERRIDFVRSWRLTRRRSSPRGLFCGIGTCFECLVDVNRESAVRACMRSLADGDDVRTSRSVGAASTSVPGADVH